MKKVLAISINPSIDRIICFNKNLKHPDIESFVFAGGKAVNVARLLTCMGKDAFVQGIIGGATGEYLKRLLDEEKINHCFFKNPIATRTNLTVCNFINQKQVRVFSSADKSSPKIAEAFLREFKRNIKYSSLLVLSGSNLYGLGDGFFRKIVLCAKKSRIPVAVDTHAKILQKILPLEPDIIKPNQIEAEEVLAYPLKDLQSYKKAVVDFHRKGAKIVLLTLGVNGAVCSNQKEMYFIRHLKIRILNDVGCGDAFLGGFVDAFLENKSFKQCVQLAGACALEATQSLKPAYVKKKSVYKRLKDIKVEIL